MSLDKVLKCVNKQLSVKALMESMKEYSMDKCEGYDLLGCYDCAGYEILCSGYTVKEVI
jgi:hypothetical protein